MTGRLSPATVCFSSNAASVHTALPRAVSAYLQACLDHIDASDQGNVIPRSSAINELAKHAAKSSLEDYWIPYPKPRRDRCVRQPAQTMDQAFGW
jgi:hypothetical protein